MKPNLLPLGVGVGINCFIAKTAWSPLACLEAGIAIESEEETFGVDVLAKCGHAGWEFGLVLNDFGCGFVPIDLPAVIQVHVFVALGGQSSADKQIHSLLDQSLVDVAAEAVP